MNLYAFKAGALFGFGIAVHFLNKAIGTAPLSQVLLEHIPVLVTWITITITFTLFILDDVHRHGTLLDIKSRIKTNDAYKLLPVVLGYQVITHIALLVDYPVVEALIALGVLSYFCYEYSEL